MQTRNMKDNKNTYTDLKTKKLEKSKLEIMASVPSLFWETFRAEALKNPNETEADQKKMSQQMSDHFGTFKKHIEDGNK